MLNGYSILMLIAASALGSTALIPTDASARSFGSGGFHAAASPNIAATSFNRGTVKTAPVKTAPVQSGNARSFTRSTGQTGTSRSAANLPRKTDGTVTGANATTHNKPPLGNATPRNSGGPLGTGNATAHNQANQGGTGGNQSNQGGSGIQCVRAPCPGSAGNQSNQGGSGNQSNQGDSGNQVNQSGTGNTVTQTNQTTNKINNFGGGGGGGGGISIGGGGSSDAGSSAVASAPAPSRRVYQGSGTQVVAVPRLSPPPASCFRKDYLPDGALVLFDDCTKQQVTIRLGGDTTCMQTQDEQAGSVWFADMCVRQQVLAPPAASMEALSLIYKKTAVSQK
jgi:hypothetical protein